MVQFQVRDTGIGIAKKEFRKLFRPFSQIHRGMTREYGGTGLGLVICQRLVDLMDGTISVESREGEGSTFTFTLPLLLNFNADASVELERPPEPVRAPRMKELTGSVLIVEDNESNALYIKALVDLRGAEVVAVAKGESALALLKEEAFDLVLLDLHMPGIGGLETLKRIRASEDEAVRGLPVFILTADASATAVEESQSLGADGLLVKPIQPTDIYDILSKHLRSP